MATEHETAATIARLEQRLEAIEGHLEIANLKSTYGSLADARYTRKGPKPQSEIDGLAIELADLFTQDAIWEAGGDLGRCEGRDAIRERFAAPTLHFSWHFFVKPNLCIKGERADGTWDVFALCTTQEGRAMWMVGVEYDEYQRVDGRWLHSRMRLDARLMAPYATGWSRD